MVAIAERTTAQFAHETDFKVLTLKTRIERDFLELGALLRLVRDEELYRYLDCETMAEYLGREELGISASHAKRLMGEVELYGPLIEAGITTAEELATIGTSKIQVVSPVIRGEPEAVAREWLDTARTQSRSGLRRAIREAAGQATDEHIEHISRQLVRMAYALLDAPDAVVALTDMIRWASERLAALEANDERDEGAV